MKTVAVVPVKLQNARFPGKNIKRLYDGRPLIACIQETLLQVKKIDAVYVYCSDASVRDFLLPGVRFLQRDSRLDLQTTAFNEVLFAFAGDVAADLYVLAHATAPFVSTASFEKGIEAVAEQGYDSALTVTKLQEFIWKDGQPWNYSPENIPRTQDLEPLFTETCGMYVYTADLICREHRRVGYRPFLIEVSRLEACDINYPEDFDLANALLRTQREDLSGSLHP